MHKENNKRFFAGKVGVYNSRFFGFEVVVVLKAGRTDPPAPTPADS
jgi:hypothetical protein